MFPTAGSADVALCHPSDYRNPYSSDNRDPPWYPRLVYVRQTLNNARGRFAPLQVSRISNSPTQLGATHPTRCHPPIKPCLLPPNSCCVQNPSTRNRVCEYAWTRCARYQGSSVMLMQPPGMRRHTKLVATHLPAQDARIPAARQGPNVGDQF